MLCKWICFVAQSKGALREIKGLSHYQTTHPLDQAGTSFTFIEQMQQLAAL